MIRAIPATLFAADDPRRAEATGRAARLLNEIASALTTGGGPSWSGSTMIVAATDPLLVVGRRTYLHDILVAMGASNAVDASGWVELSLEDVLRLDPEAIIVVREQAAPGLDPVEAAGALGRLDTRARRAGRIELLQHPDANLPSSGVIGVAAQMRRALRRLAEAGA
jgi:ABC-type Fe3+-hydroxamate transport system substrate-binding protein